MFQIYRIQSSILPSSRTVALLVMFEQPWRYISECCLRVKILFVKSLAYSK